MVRRAHGARYGWPGDRLWERIFEQRLVKQEKWTAPIAYYFSPANIGGEAPRLAWYEVR